MWALFNIVLKIVVKLQKVNPHSLMQSAGAVPPTAVTPNNIHELKTSSVVAAGKGSVLAIIKHLGYWKVCAQWGPECWQIHMKKQEKYSGNSHS